MGHTRTRGIRGEQYIRNTTFGVMSESNITLPLIYYDRTVEYALNVGRLPNALSVRRLNSNLGACEWIYLTCLQIGLDLICL